MNIGEAAKASGVSAKKVRYYEAIGLIQAAKRRASGYRQYELSDVHRLRFIRLSRDFGFSLGSIREMLELWESPKSSGAEIRAVALARVAELERRAEQIDAMIGALRQLAKESQRGRQPGWPIVDDAETRLTLPQKTRKPTR